ncbi:separase [Malassezia brasiliensis]|uniref:separase n=1 Tax=Malassezia brasiliensis TaxID=1821822 RepID=A0AAF0DSJ0_9BASI|nr:separase [Malassezia brasiliensis]
MPTLAARAPARSADGGAPRRKAPAFDEVLRRLSTATALERPVVAAVLTHLPAADLARSISLYTSTHTDVCAAGLAWSTGGMRKAHAGTDAARERRAKQVANAVLAGMQQLVEKPTTTRRTSMARTDDEVAIPILLDCFRIAMATLATSACAPDTLVHVGLSAVRKLDKVQRVRFSLTQHDEALTELVAVASVVYPRMSHGTVRAPPAVLDRLNAVLSQPGASSATSATAAAVVELQALAVHVAVAQMPSGASLEWADVVRVPDGPEAWQAAARAQGVDGAADRAAYLLERAVFQQLAPHLASEAARLQVKMDTLLQLSYVSHLDVEAFWDRVAKVSMGYVRRAGDAHFDEVHTHLVRLVHAAHARCHGVAYERLSAWWLAMAEKVCDKLIQVAHPAADELARHVRDGADVSVLRASDADVASADATESLAALHLDASTGTDLGTLAKQWAAHRDAPSAAACVATLTSLMPASTDDATRTALTALLHDTLADVPSAPSAPVLDVLAASAAAVERCVCVAATSDAIHALRVVSVSRMDDAQPATYGASLDALQLAARLAGSSGSRRTYVSDVAFHLGSRLYARAAYAHAVPFLRLAWDIGRDVDPEDDAQAPRPRKGHLLAGAYQHMGRFAEAYAAYLDAMRACPALNDAGDVASAHALPDALDEGPLALSSALVRGALHVAVYCLLLPTDVADPASFAAALRSLGLSGASYAAWCEYAALTLEPLLMRDETPAALDTMHAAALEVYTVERYPLRRARVLLKIALYATLRGDMRTVDLGACLAAPPAEDAQLAHLRNALQALEAMQRILSLVATAPTGTASLDAAADAAAEALAHINTHLAGPTTSGRTRAHAPHTAPTPTPTRTSARMAARTARSAALTATPRTRSSRAAAAAPATPAPSTPPRVAPPTTSPSGAASAAHALAHVLSATCDALLYAGLDAAAANGLGALVRLAQAAGMPDLVACASVRLAELWIRVGAPDTAIHALHASPRTPAVLYTLAHAQSARGDADAAKTYADATSHAATDTPTPASSANRVAAKCTAYALRASAAHAAASLARDHYSVYADAVSAKLQALRLHLRTSLLLGQAGGETDVFAARTPSAPGPPRHALLALRAWHWRVSAALIHTYGALATLYAERGATRDAAAFAHEAVAFADAQPPPLPRAAAHAAHAALQTALGAHEAAQLSLDTARSLLGGMPSLARAHVAELDANRAADGAAHEAARTARQAARAALHLREAAPPTDSAEALVQRAATLVADAEHLLHTDAVWSMLPEAARALPGAAPRPATRAQAALVRRAAPLLDDAERALSVALQRTAMVGDVRIVRRALRTAYAACLLQAVVRPDQQTERARRAAALLNAAASVSVRRAFVDVAFRRAHPVPSDGTPHVPPPPPPPPTRIHASVASDASLGREVHWALPAHTAAVVVSLSDDRRELHLAHITPATCAVYTLPIDRQSRREGDEEAYTPDAVLDELRTILTASNASVHTAKDVHALEARKAWWTHRRELDAALRTLLEGVQATWLGAFQGLLAPPPTLLAPLRTQATRALANACTGHTAHGDAIVLSDAAVVCLAALPSDCTIEVLEDWAHFAMDACQLSGVPIAQDEVDMDELCVDLRSALDEHHARVRRAHDGAPAEDDAHLFLVLDREVCDLPWESLPVLRARSVSRVPALEFVGAAHEPHDTPVPPTTLDPRRTAYLLNPSGDLVRSEARFAPLLRAQPGWHGTIGHAPIVDEVARALGKADTFLYFGHAGGELYVQPTQLRALQRCAAAMLWGCSSGVLRDGGSFDPEGTPLRYMVAQCPALVANLWDATDKELDGVCEAVLRAVGLLPGGPAPIPLARAVAHARSQCKLPYLTGAACIVYGVPATWLGA